MKSIVCIAALSLGLGLSGAYAAEEINPRTLDDANTPRQQDEKAARGGKQKAIENATEQQADPNVTPSRHDAQGHPSTEQPQDRLERR
ncbi:hypothetical protein [Methylobacillus flagellatus]|uniref:Uncharacterized protein n=1 Tax=Methylobacillus flagellatus (strain ATCC 51484 / DSM 6875 / VKM B-1610 / KT) TaxID=265072 RepID=Q1H1C6_METFK|nr:hypothetical protein [Methylobacillus flagellatus]ABE49711.1 hypothetical protein Mfla_1443 [Methylobacillus flagellatus KT]